MKGNMFLGSKILTSIQAYRREKEEFKVNWPRSYSVLKKKKIQEAEYIIYPHQKAKIIWDFFVGGLILESVIMVPLTLGFNIISKGPIFYFNVIVDICFGIDMLLTFFTAYEKDSVLIVEYDKIFKNYMKSWFTVDFLSTFPFDKILPLLLEGISPGTIRSIKLVRTLRLFRLLKLFRVARLNRKIKDAKIEDAIHPVVYDLMGLFFWIFMASHILCCGFYYFSGCNDEEGDWQSCGKDDLTSQYILSMYWTVATILSVGYGDVFLTTNSGRLFSTFVIFLGSIIFGFLVATVQSSARNWNIQESERVTKLNQVREYIYEKKVIGSLRRRMSSHFEYYYTHKANLSEEAIVLEMPIILRQYALENTKKELMNLIFFKSISLDIVMEIVPHLNPYCTKNGEYICREGEFCMDMFFLINGFVEAYKKNHDNGVKGNYLVGMYQTGSEFGLKRAMRCDGVAWASFRSCDKCDLQWLSNDSIQTLVKSNSVIKEVFMDEADREFELMQYMDANLATEKLGKVNNTNDRETMQGAFKIPKHVILNNVTIISIKAATRILQNVDRIEDDATDQCPTFKTVTVMGKNMNGQDNYIYRQETTADMWKRWVINPRCPYKLYFDLVIVIMVVVSSLTVPYRIGFDLSTTFEWSIVDGTEELFFCLDLVSAFFTAYEYKDGTLDTNRKNIALRYLRSWFVIDFLSAIPFYRMTTGKSTIGVLAKLLKTLKLGRLFRLFKVFKFARIMKLLEISNQEFMPNEFIAIENSFGQMFKLLIFLGFTTHIIACIFSWISIESDGSTWASETTDAESTLKRYVAAQYWTYVTMATVGYGDIFARNDSERLFSIVVMILGSTGLAYIVSELSDHVFNKGSGKGQQDHKLSISRDYFILNSTPQSWRDALIKHFSFLVDKQTAFDHRLIWSQMPHSIRMDLLHHISHEDFAKITLLKSLKPSVLCALYKYTEYCMLPEDSFMYTFETGSGGLYFVLKGYAEVIDEKDDSSSVDNPLMVVSSIQEGMFFGHESILKTTFDYLGIRARCDLFTLFISSESVARMKEEVPLIYDTLVYIIEEAVKICFGTYDVSSNIGVLKRNISKIIRFRNFVKKDKPPDPGEKVKKPFSQMYNWFNSDVDEAKSLYQLFTGGNMKSAVRAKKHAIDEYTKSIMSDGSYDKFHNLKSERVELDRSSRPKSLSRSSSRNVYASLYGVTPEERRKYSRSQSQVSHINEIDGESDENSNNDSDENLNSCVQSVGHDKIQTDETTIKDTAEEFAKF